jgi:anti-sigma regulatory factor (Ser/Thr protein kinase)
MTARMDCPAKRSGTQSRNWLHESVLSYKPRESAVPTARARTKAILNQWGLSTLAKTAEIVISELVTNSIQATVRLGLNAPVGIRMVADCSWLVVEVWDCAHAAPRLRQRDIMTELGSGDLSDGHGNGLVAVAALSHQWGYFWRPDGGKVVFAVFSLQEHPHGA